MNIYIYICIYNGAVKLFSDIHDIDNIDLVEKAYYNTNLKHNCFTSDFNKFTEAIFKVKFTETKFGTNQARKYWSPRRLEDISFQHSQIVL